MAGFKTFVAGEILTAADVNSFLMSQAISVFADATARNAAITSPVEGQFAFRTDDDVLEYWDGSAWEEYVTAVDIEYLIIAGGGGGGGDSRGGGGGAGGYRCNIVGEKTGGDLSPDSTFSLVSGTYPIVVGAGGAGSGATDVRGGLGNSSILANVLSAGGGGGAANNTTLRSGRGGGSGGGGTEIDGRGTAGDGVNRQGFQGGAILTANAGGGGGGGAGAQGVDANSGATNGGAGLSSSITGTSVARGGGGAGAGGSPSTATGGTGGGGNTATAGTANTGGGGGARANGGSGVVIFRVKTGTLVSFSGGVTHTTTTVGDKTAYIVTATSTTSETVTIG